MSKVMLFSILDLKGQVYGPLMSFINEQTAMRSFQEMLISDDKGSLLSLYPTEYSLFCIGHFENTNGKVESLPAPTLVCTGFEACTKAIDEANRRRQFREKINGIRNQNNLGSSPSVAFNDADGDLSDNPRAQDMILPSDC